MLLPIFIGLLIIMFAFMHMNDQKVTKTKESFWRKEQEANNTKKQTLDDLDYIHIPIDTLPLHRNDADETLAKIEQEIMVLSNSEIVNFTEISNTDLKLTYGVANLPALSGFDANYTKLVRTIYAWSVRLHELGFTAEAITVLEYGVSIQTDMSKHYTYLGQLYADQSSADKLDELIGKAELLTTSTKPVILKHLNHIKSSLN